VCVLCVYNWCIKLENVIQIVIQIFQNIYPYLLGVLLKIGWNVGRNCQKKVVKKNASPRFKKIKNKSIMLINRVSTVFKKSIKIVFPTFPFPFQFWTK